MCFKSVHNDNVPHFLLFLRVGNIISVRSHNIPPPPHDQRHKKVFFQVFLSSSPLPLSQRALSFLEEEEKEEEEEAELKKTRMTTTTTMERGGEGRRERSN